MNGAGDDGLEMAPTWLIDDDTIEVIVAGGEVDDRFRSLAAFARTVRALEDEPAPTLSPALQAVFAEGTAAGRQPPWRRALPIRGLTTAAAKIAALGVAAKIGLGVSVAAASAAGAGAAGLLPDPADDSVRRAIETITPVEFEDPVPEDHDEPDRFGDRVSRDATGESDGDTGVDGPDVSDEAPGSDNRPTDPGQRGHDRAEQTPAAPHVPGGEAPPSPSSTSPEEPGPPRGRPSRDPPAASTPPSAVPPPAATVPSTVPPRRGGPPDK